jgi:hypothetical protein
MLRLQSLFLKGAQSLLWLGWGGDRQTDMHSLAFQTSHARTSTCQTFILTTAHRGMHGSPCQGRGNQTRVVSDSLKVTQMSAAQFGPWV